MNAVILEGVSFFLFLPLLCGRVLEKSSSSSHEIVDGDWGSLLPFNWSAISCPVVPECDGIHWRTIFLFLDSLLSCLHKVVVVGLSVGLTENQKVSLLCAVAGRLSQGVQLPKVMPPFML